MKTGKKYSGALRAAGIFACAAILWICFPDGYACAEQRAYPILPVGFNAGYSFLNGHYRDELNNGVYLSLSAIPFASRYLLGEIDINYSAY